VASQVLIEVLRRTPKEAKTFNNTEDLTTVVNMNIQIAEHIIDIDPRLDMELSGSTCCAVCVTAQSIVCLNVGDSRAVLGHMGDDGKPVVTPLSWDQVPTDPREQARVAVELEAWLKAGGNEQERISVAPLYNRHGKPVGAHRVWIPNPKDTSESAAGLAMSRSIGDCMGKKAGLSAKAEIETFAVDPVHDQILVIASDGLWDMISSEDALEIACMNNSSPYAAAQALRANAIRRWQEEDGVVVDDVTVLVVFKFARKDISESKRE